LVRPTAFLNLCMFKFTDISNIVSGNVSCILTFQLRQSSVRKTKTVLYSPDMKSGVRCFWNSMHLHSLRRGITDFRPRKSETELLVMTVQTKRISINDRVLSTRISESEIIYSIPTTESNFKNVWPQLQADQICFAPLPCKLFFLLTNCKAYFQRCFLKSITTFLK